MSTKSVVSLGDSFWQINYANTWWTVKQITTNPDDWLIIDKKKRVIPNNGQLGRILVHWVKKYEATQ